MDAGLDLGARRRAPRAAAVLATLAAGTLLVSDPYTLVNQVARLQRGRRRWSVAVLTDGNPHSPHAFVTLRGVARRLLGEVR